VFPILPEATTPAHDQSFLLSFREITCKYNPFPGKGKEKENFLNLNIILLQ
jgi:hypothetical protein